MGVVIGNPHMTQTMHCDHGGMHCALDWASNEWAEFGFERHRRRPRLRRARSSSTATRSATGPRAPVERLLNWRTGQVGLVACAEEVMGRLFRLLRGWREEGEWGEISRLACERVGWGLCCGGFVSRSRAVVRRDCSLHFLPYNSGSLRWKIKANLTLSQITCIFISLKNISGLYREKCIPSIKVSLLSAVSKPSYVVRYPRLGR